MEDIGSEVASFTAEMRRKLYEHFSSLPKPVLKNIAEVVVALMILLRTPRGWYGRLTLNGVARCMKTRGNLHTRYKRLDRFLKNDRFATHKAVPGLIQLTFGENLQGILPVLIDQTAAGDVQIIAASVSYKNRAVPLAMKTFEYSGIKFSQKKIEQDFFEELRSDLANVAKSLFVMDRGYADSKYIQLFNQQKQLYIIRGIRNVMVEYKERGKTRKINLGRLPHRQGRVKRFRNVMCHDKARAVVDIIVYREEGFQEPWFLIVPPGTEDILSSKKVVDLYASRMRIEVKFRDFKSHLGIRGLSLKVNKAEKIGRLMVCLAIVYVLLLVIGDSPMAKQFRRRVEIKRTKKRHGTRRTLSVLTVAIFMITDSFLLNLANVMRFLSSTLNGASGGLCACG